MQSSAISTEQEGEEWLENNRLLFDDIYESSDGEEHSDGVGSLQRRKEQVLQRYRDEKAKQTQHLQFLEERDAKKKGSIVQFSFGPSVSVAVPSEGKNIEGKIWRASLLCSAYVLGMPIHLGAIKAPASSMCRGKDVLEIGCGRALVGLAACQAGARSVVLTDCHDSALLSLQQLSISRKLNQNRDTDQEVKDTQQDVNFEVRHLLWEQDLQFEDRAAERAKLNASGNGAGESGGQKEVKIRHWSDAYRQKSSLLELEADRTFDLVIASDCLYFTSQEDPLVAVLKRRLRPQGQAVIVFQTRKNEFFLSRMLKSLETNHFQAEIDQGPWDWSQLMQTHVHLDNNLEKTDVLHQTANDLVDPHVLLVTRRQPAAAV